MTESTEVQTEIKPNVISEAQSQLSIRNNALLRMQSASSLDWAITCVKSRRHKHKDTQIGKMLPFLIIILESMRDDDMKEAREILSKLK
jgi:hypothetical protein